MDEYISKEEAIKELREVYEQEYPTASGDFDEYASRDVPNVLRNMKAANVQPVDFVQNEVLNYLFNKERETENMPYGNERQVRFQILQEIIRYVEGIGDTNG